MTGIDVAIDQRNAGAWIAHVTIHNERKLNTLNRSLMIDFAREINRLRDNPDLRAVIVTGAGDKAFIGGADINEMAALDRETAPQFITALHDCCEALRKLPVPVIARIQGYALGAGLELAASCDLRIAADSAVFGMPEVKLGIPSVIEAALLPALVGWGRARQIVLLGENFTAAQAEAWGLVELVVPTSELDTAVERWIQSILNSGPNAIRLQKTLIRAWEDLPLRDAIHAGIASFTEAWKTQEPVARMREFQASRRAHRNESLTPDSRERPTLRP